MQNPLWKNAKRLMKEWDNDPMDLLDHIANGLPVHKARHESTLIEDGAEVFFNTVDMNYEEIENYVSLLEFKKTDVKQYEENYKNGQTNNANIFKCKDLIREIKRSGEIEIIYSAIKKIGFSSKIVDAEKKWKKAALDCFTETESKNKFKYIKFEYLEDDSLYFFSGGKELRDFEGRILQKIIEGYELGDFGRSDLRRLYKDISF